MDHSCAEPLGSRKRPSDTSPIGTHSDKKRISDVGEQHTVTLKTTSATETTDCAEADLERGVDVEATYAQALTALKVHVRTLVESCKLGNTRIELKEVSELDLNLRRVETAVDSFKVSLRTSLEDAEKRIGSLRTSLEAAQRKRDELLARPPQSLDPLAICLRYARRDPEAARVYLESRISAATTAEDFAELTDLIWPPDSLRQVPLSSERITSFREVRGVLVVPESKADSKALAGLAGQFRLLPRLLTQRPGTAAVLHTTDTWESLAGTLGNGSENRYLVVGILRRNKFYDEAMITLFRFVIERMTHLSVSATTKPPLLYVAHQWRSEWTLRMLAALVAQSSRDGLIEVCRVDDQDDQDKQDEENAKDKEDNEDQESCPGSPILTSWDTDWELDDISMVANINGEPAPRRRRLPLL